MKKKLLIGSSIGLLLLFIIFLYKGNLPNVPKSHIIINKLDSIPAESLNLFYSDINLKNTVSYGLHDGTLLPSSTHYIPYTEGFISDTLYKKIIASLAKYDASIPSYFHDYYIAGSLAVVAFSGGLEHIYLVDLDKERTYPLIFDASQNLGDMYVSHMEVVDHYLIILGGEAHAYSSLIYTVDLETGKVISAKRLPTHPSTLYEEDFAILSSGECIFTAGNTIQRYNPFLDTVTYTNLPFTTTRVLPYRDTGLAFEEAEGQLQVVSLDGSLHTTLKMPVMNYRIVDLLIEDDLLYMALFDPNAIRYPNYLCIYDLKTGEWLYALGIESLTRHALLFIEI